MPTPEGLHPSDSIQTEVDFVLRFPAGGQRTLYVRHCGRVKVLQFVYGRELPVYREFTTVDELKNFYTAAMAHVQGTLAAGWKAKDEIDFGLYRV